MTHSCKTGENYHNCLTLSFFQHSRFRSELIISVIERGERRNNVLVDIRFIVWNWLMNKNEAVAGLWRRDSVTPTLQIWRRCYWRAAAQKTWQSPCSRHDSSSRHIVRGVINYGADETWWQLRCQWDDRRDTSHNDIWTDPQPPHQRCLCESLNVTDSVYLCI